MLISLPWPDKTLSPNARNHWAKTAKAKKLARLEACLLVKSQLPFKERQSIAQGDDKIACKITFYPPDNRRRDDDNMVSSFKAARDGLADALGIDDRRLRPHYFFEDAEKPGRVEVSF